MGLVSGLLTLPILPLRGTIWIAEQVLKQAEDQYYDPGAIRRQIEQVDAALEAGDISEEEAAEMHESLIQRLLEGRSSGRT